MINSPNCTIVPLIDRHFTYKNRQFRLAGPEKFRLIAVSEGIQEDYRVQHVGKGEFPASPCNVYRLSPSVNPFGYERQVAICELA